MASGSMQPKGLGLTEWVYSVIRDPAPEPVYSAGPACRMLASAIGDGDRASSLIANAFWQAYLHSEALISHFKNHDLFLAPREIRRRCLIVPHRNGRYTLVVRHPSLRPGDTIVLGAYVSEQGLRSGYRASREHLVVSLPVENLELLESCVVEAGSKVQFFVLVTAINEEVVTTIPSFPIGVQSQAVCTAGAVVSKADLWGVTVAAHAITTDSVTVGGQPGKVVCRDNNSDACFIAIDGRPFKVTPTKGPLTLAPRLHEQVSFNGITSGIVICRVVGWSYNLPFLDPFVQPLVYTGAVTARGDSGAALIDSDLAIVGFAYSRSALGSHLEYSTWIWGSAVFTGLGVSIHDPETSLGKSA